MPAIDDYRRKIKEVRRSRVKATKAESHTAVASLHRLESDLIARIAELEAPPKEVDPWAGLTEAQILDNVVALIQSLPPDVQEIVRERTSPRAAGLQVVR